MIRLCLVVAVAIAAIASLTGVVGNAINAVRASHAQVAESGSTLNKTSYRLVSSQGWAYVWRDPETGCHYLVTRTNGGEHLTPRLRAGTNYPFCGDKP